METESSCDEAINICQTAKRSLKLIQLNCSALTVPLEKFQPPNKDAIFQHLLRANYQAAIGRHHLQPMMEIQTPEERDWIKKDELLYAHWLERSPSSADVLQLRIVPTRKVVIIFGVCSHFIRRLVCGALNFTNCATHKNQVEDAEG